MEHNENNIKDMRGDHQPLPPELEWSNMKDGILEKMNSIKQAELSQPADKNSHRRTWLLFALLLMLSVATTAGWFIHNRGASEDQSIANDRQAHTSLPPESAPGTLEQNILTPDGGPTSLNFNETEASSLTHSPLQLNDLADSLQTIGTVQKPNAQLSETVTGTIGSFQVIVSDSGRSSSRLQSSETVKSLLSPLMAPPAQALDIQFTAPESLPMLSPDLLESTNLPLSFTSRQEPDKIPLPSIEDGNSKNLFVLEGGLNFWTEGYGKSNPDREQYEAPILSFQVQGSYQRGLTDGYFILAGVQYQQLESRLDYSNKIEDYQITLTDTIIQVRKNLLTGEEILIRGDAVQTVQAERVVRHFNKTQLLRTSLAFGKSWQFNSFQTDVYLGSAFGAIIGNEGRMFSGDDILDYTGLSTPFYQNRWTVDGLLGARFHYFPFERVGITTGFLAQRSLMNWSNQPNIRFFPTSLGVQLGVSYSL